MPTVTRQSASLDGGQSAPTFDLPPCCTRTGAPILPATIHLRNNVHIINDTGCLHANIVSANIAKLLATDGGQNFGINIVLTAGVGGQSYGVQGIMNVTVTLKVLGAEETSKYICLRSIVCKDVNINFIIGLPFYNLLPLLKTHTRSLSQCKICHEYNKPVITLPVAYIYLDTDRLLNNHVDGPTPGVNENSLRTERDFITEFHQLWGSATQGILRQY